MQEREERVIQPLPEQLVKQLRSSAVFSDVSQIVDELVCNSLDAKATEVCVHVDVKACYVRVEDDGVGINRDDFEILGERHATSKLHSQEDLETGISTLGFRGEALSCISDLGLLEITSRSRGSPHTYRKILKNSKALTLGLSGQQRDQGTTVVVKDAFYNQPVRRKYFNESSHKVLQLVSDQMFRLALIHPKVSFTVMNLERNEKLLDAKTTDSLSSRIRDLFGKQVRDSLQKIDFAKAGFRLSGYISQELSLTPVKLLQYLYVNRRFVRRTPLHKLVKSWQKASVEASGPISFVLNLGCPPGEFDVTLDASKTLVEFKDWKFVLSFFQEVLASVWHSKAPLPPEIAISPLRKRKCPDNNSKTVENPVCEDEPLLSKWRHCPSDKIDELRQHVSVTFERPVLEVGQGSLSMSSGVLVPEYISKDSFLRARVLNQVDSKFIAAVTNGNLILIDQHAADERICLEELRSSVLANGGGGSVTMEHPEEMTLGPIEKELLVAYKDKVEFWGWRTNTAGEKVTLTMAPSIMGVQLAAADLLDYLRQLGETHGSSAPPSAVTRILNYKACRGAIMFGDKLFLSECQQLVSALKKTDLCFQCAHGRPTMVPIVNLPALKSRCQTLATASVKIQDDKASLSTSDSQDWHGLRRQTPTLQRAYARLKQAATNS